eukprot:COSAG01_NODE_22654_length_846_cov_330.781794_1_plen_89_part_10
MVAKCGAWRHAPWPSAGHGATRRGQVRGRRPEILQLPCDVWIAVAAGAAVGLGAALWAMVVPKKKGRRRRLAAEASISNGNTLHTSIIE